jgi:hypothetical protein
LLNTVVNNTDTRWNKRVRTPITEVRTVAP